MLYAEIFIDGEWKALYLQSGTSISMEHRSWVFDTESCGAFSYPFELNIEANKHLFGSTSDIHGEKLRKVLKGLKARVYFSGTPFFSGTIRLDDEITVEDGYINIEIANGHQSFADMIEDMNCQDVEVKDKVCVGTVAEKIDITVYLKYTDPDTGVTSDFENSFSADIPSSVFTSNKWYEEYGVEHDAINVSKPYPEKEYCNVRICIQHRKKKDDGSYETTREYEVFEADRPDSGVCFYVLYFLDCLFAKLGIAFDNTSLMAMEDFCRLAFFTTQCHYDTIVAPISNVDAQRLFDGVTTNISLSSTTSISNYSFQKQNGEILANIVPKAKYKHANSKNFPNEKVSDVIKNVQNAFGVRLEFDKGNNRCKAHFIKDILRDSSIHESSIIITDVQKTETETAGYVLTYGNNSDDTNFKYTPEESPVIELDFRTIRSKANNPQDKNAYYDSKTGNLYRIKVDDDAEKEEELYPSLFEVAAFQDAWIGDKNEQTVKKVEIGFTPIVENIIEYTSDRQSAGIWNWTTTKQSTTSDKETTPVFAAFINAEIADPEELMMWLPFQTTPLRTTGNLYQALTFYFKIKYLQRYGYTQDYLKKLTKYYTSEYRLPFSGGSKPIVEYTTSPFAEHESGLSLCIMRGPGNNAGIETFEEDYDGEENSKYQYVSTTYNSHSDSIDQFGNGFDYNGTAEGGIDYSTRFSLKPSAKKRVEDITSFSANNEITNKKDALYWLEIILYKYANLPSLPLSWGHKVLDLKNMPLVKASDLKSAGWKVEPGRVYYPIYPLSIVKNDHNGYSYWLIVNAFNEAGNILTKSEYDACVAGDNKGLYGFNYLLDYAIFIGMLDSEHPQSNEILEDIQGLMDVYYELADSYTLKSVDGEKATYYPIDSSFANRGLLETFHSEIAYLEMNKKMITLKGHCEVAELLRYIEHMEWKWRFGSIVGFINKIKYTLSMENGLTDLEIELIYL